MIPIVFWASFAPWFRLKNAAEMSCSRRNQRSTREGGVQRSSQWIATISPSPAVKPMSGERKIKMIVLVQPLTMMAPKPAFATAAPAYPPTRACDELVGSPKYQVMRSQMIAPDRPPKITDRVAMLMSIIPEPTVLAPVVPMVTDATTLQKAAQMTASPGDSTRVDTMVAIELAASWNPLM